MDTPSTSAGHKNNEIREEFLRRRCVPSDTDSAESDNETADQSVSNRYVLPDNNEMEIDSDADTAESDVADNTDTAELEVDLPSDTDTANTDEGESFFNFVTLTKTKFHPPIFENVIQKTNPPV